jgi:hypothetical protein
MNENDLPTLATEEPTRPELAAAELVVQDTSAYAMLFDSARFNQAQRVAKLFANSKLVPAHFQGNTAGVFVILHLATRMDLDPFMVLQNTYMIHGRPGMEAKLVIALVNARGPFKGPIQWRFEGEGKNRKCTAFAYHKDTDELCEITLEWQTVEKEGWAGKSGSKWMTMPELMFRYRTAAMLARLYCPETIMGLATVDELQDIGDDIIDLDAEYKTDPKQTQTDKLKEEFRTRKVRSDKGISRKATESPVEALEEQTNTNPPVSPQNLTTGLVGAFKAISPEMEAELRQIPPDILHEIYLSCGVNLDTPIDELDFETAERLLVTARKL